jgi:creatinine amidohydrolase
VSRDAAEDGVALLAERIARIPEALDDVAAHPAPDLAVEARTARRIVVTGLGASATAARLLVRLLSDPGPTPARFAATSGLLLAPSGAEDDLLVVFSQGLSPNARLVLSRPEAWRRVVLVTATGAGGGQRADAVEKRALLAQLEAAGGVVVRTSGEDEYGTLVRLLGPVVAFARAFDLARALGARAPAVDPKALVAAMARAAADAEAEIAARGVPEPGEPVAFVASGEHTGLVENLPRKLLEGWLGPHPAVFDVLDLAHGPLQQLSAGRATLVALAREDAPCEAALFDTLARALDPSRHRLLRFPARLPDALALFEHEAATNALLLAGLRARGLDPRVWPGREAEPALYRLARAPSPPPLLEELTWPELEDFVASGRRTLVVGLGATEQHGPHLPFATDTWIAEELVRRLCARLDDTIGAPVVPVGCSPEHLAFPGTLSLERETLARWLRDLLGSAARHGFETAFLFSAHGGNATPLRELLPALAADLAPLRVLSFADLASVAALQRSTSERLGVDPADAGHHAGELETSILLALRPASVRRERLAPGLRCERADGQELFYPSLRRHAPTGVVGDPRRADAARAEAYLDAWVDALAAAYRRAKNESQTNGTKTP